MSENRDRGGERDDGTPAGADDESGREHRGDSDGGDEAHGTPGDAPKVGDGELKEPSGADEGASGTRLGVGDVARTPRRDTPRDEARRSTHKLPDHDSAAAPTDYIGRHFGGYRIVQKLAEGGMGEIYIGEHTQLGRRAALKLLKLEYCRNQEVVERFTQEARAVNAIQHENIIDIYDIGRDDDGRVYFVMELLEGEPLDRRIERGPLPWSEAHPFLEQTIRALAAAHAKGFVHRDLKPENIFLRTRADGSTTVTLLDFGIAKLTGPGERDPEQRPLTQVGAIMGTPHYMSPEQINAAADVDHRTDIYALGVITYEMFAGRLPFSSTTITAILSDHLFTAPPLLQPDESLGAPEGLPRVVERMLAKEVGDRYDTADDLLADIEDLAASLPPRLAETLHRERPLGKRRGRRARWWGSPLAAGALALAGGALAASLFFGLGDDDARPHAPDEAPEQAEAQPDIDEMRERAEAALRGALSESAPEHRVQATEGLAAVRDKPSVPALLETAKRDPDDEVRGHAAGALGALGASEVAPELRELREDARPALKTWIDEALARLRDSDARQRLVEATQADDLAVSFKASLALAELSGPGDEEAIGALTSLAAREAELTRIAPYAGIALLAQLTALHHEGAREALEAALDEPDEGARVAAADALARLGYDEGREVLEDILGDEDSPNRLLAARALAALADDAGAGLMHDSLTAGDTDERRQAARGLGELGDVDNLEPLFERLEGDDDASVEIAAATSLILLAGLDAVRLAQSSVDWARSALGAEDAAVRAAAARTVGDLEQSEAVPLLAAAVVDDDAEVRKAAARSAQRLRGPEAAREVASAAREEEEPAVQEEQVIALAEIGDPEGEDALREIADSRARVGLLASGALLRLDTDDDALGRLDDAISHRRVEIRQAAAEGATLSENPLTIPVLAVGVGDPNFFVRFASARGLAEYRASSDEAIEVLREGLERTAPEIQAAAQVGLQRLGVNPAAALSAREMLSSPSVGVRRAALPVIESLPWDEALPLLRRAIRERDREVRRRAVDVIAEAALEHPDDATRLFQSLLRDEDDVTRTKARAHLARLRERARDAELAEAAITPDSEALAALEDLLEDAAAAARAFEASLAEAREVADAIETETAEPAEDDDDVEYVESLAERADRAGRRAARAKAELARTVMRARGAAAELGAPVPTEHATALSKAEISAADAVARRDEAREIAEEAEREAQAYAREHTADPELYLTSARTSTATGDLARARRDLARAERMFAAQGETPPHFYFAYAELYAEIALRESEPAEIAKNLERARGYFQRVVEGGGGARREEARARLDDIELELASLDDGAD